MKRMRWTNASAERARKMKYVCLTGMPIVVMILGAVVTVSTSNEITEACSVFSFTCFLQLLFCFIAFIPHTSFFIGIVKFLTVCLLLEQCLDTLNAGLTSLPAGRPPARRPQLQRLARFQRLTAECLSRLTSASASEMVPVTLYGVLSLVGLLVLTEFFFRFGLNLSIVLSLVNQAFGASLALIGPCEATHRLLSRLAVLRDRLLLLPSQLQSERLQTEELHPEQLHPEQPQPEQLQTEELQQEQPQPEQLQTEQLRRDTELMLLIAGRDLETTGDLGLFRLQRSTLLSVLSTIITYLVITVQFLSTGGRPEGTAQGGNLTIFSVELG